MPKTLSPKAVAMMGAYSTAKTFADEVTRHWDNMKAAGKKKKKKGPSLTGDPMIDKQIQAIYDRDERMKKPFNR